MSYDGVLIPIFAREIKQKFTAITIIIIIIIIIIIVEFVVLGRLQTYSKNNGAVQKTNKTEKALTYKLIVKSTRKEMCLNFNLCLLVCI